MGLGLEVSGLRSNPQCELMSRSTCISGTINGGKVPEEGRWERVSASRSPGVLQMGRQGRDPLASSQGGRQDGG